MIKTFIKNFLFFTILFIIIFFPYNEYRKLPNTKILIISFILIFLVSYIKSINKNKK